MESTTIKDQALKFLRRDEQLTAVLSTASLDGIPHAATIYYFVDDSLTFYFLTATDTQKYRDLQVNPKAALAVGFGPSYTTLQGAGTATLLEKASEEENNAIGLIKKRLQDHGNKTWPVFQLDKFDREAIAVFKFVPESLQLLNLEHDNGLTVTTEEIIQVI